jgi:hypothetical protein
MIDQEVLPMNDMTRDDIRRLLKNFGIQADDAIQAYLDRLPEGTLSIQLRITLEDLTDYGDEPPAGKLHLEIEGTVRG